VRESSSRERQADLVTEAQVTFTYSNPGWRLTWTLSAPLAAPGLSVNCRRIPDGVRYFTQSAQASETTNQAARLPPLSPFDRVSATGAARAVALLAEPLPGP